MERGNSFTGTVVQIQVAERENKLDTGDERSRQRLRSQKIRTDCRSYYEVTRRQFRRD